MRTRLIAVLAAAGFVLALVTGVAQATHFHNTPTAAPADTAHFHNAPLAAASNKTYYHD